MTTIKEIEERFTEEFGKDQYGGKQAMRQDLIIPFLRTEITALLEGIKKDADEKKIAGGNYNCGEEGCCNPNPEDKRELEDVDFQCGYNQAIADFKEIINKHK